MDFIGGKIVGVKWPEAPPGFEDWEFPGTFLYGLPTGKDFLIGKERKVTSKLLNRYIEEAEKVINNNKNLSRISDWRFMAEELANKMEKYVIDTMSPKK